MVLSRSFDAWSRFAHHWDRYSKAVLRGEGSCEVEQISGLQETAIRKPWRSPLKADKLQLTRNPYGKPESITCVNKSTHTDVMPVESNQHPSSLPCGYHITNRMSLYITPIPGVPRPSNPSTLNTGGESI